MMRIDQAKPEALVIGAGPAGLMAAEQLARAGARVTLCEAMPSLARKFLMAGVGGLNITHAEPFDLFLTRYGARAPQFDAALRAYLRHCGLRFGAFDLIVTPEGEHVFLELNPNGQWYWVELATKAPMAEAMADLLEAP